MIKLQRHDHHHHHHLAEREREIERQEKAEMRCREHTKHLLAEPKQNNKQQQQQHTKMKDLFDWSEEPQTFLSLFPNSPT